MITRKQMIDFCAMVGAYDRANQLASMTDDQWQAEQERQAKRRDDDRRH